MSAEPTVEAVPIAEPSQELVPQNGNGGQLIFKTDDPMEIMARTSEIATALKEFVKVQGLTSVIGGRDYIEVEGWQMLGMMLGVSPVVKTTRPVADGWEAVVELQDRSGRVVGAGEAECLVTEKTWKNRDDYARRSMAQTRAIGKAYRNTFGFIAKAAGYEVLAAEEVDGEATEAEEVPEHATGPEAEAADRENRALLDELQGTYGLKKAKAEALFDGYRTLEQKKALTARLGEMIEAQQAKAGEAK